MLDSVVASAEWMKVALAGRPEREGQKMVQVAVLGGAGASGMGAGDMASDDVVGQRSRRPVLGATVVEERSGRASTMSRRHVESDWKARSRSVWAVMAPYPVR